MKYRKIPPRDFSTGTGIWVVSCDAKNRPASFRDVSTGTLVECAYDYRGRRCTKKVTVAGTAMRPLTFRHAEKSLMLFYAFDGNKNVSDLFFLALQNGIGAHYEYAPFGAVTRTAKATSSKVDLIGANPWRFSSEFYDSELDLVYYPATPSRNEAGSTSTPSSGTFRHHLLIIKVDLRSLSAA